MGLRRTIVAVGVGVALAYFLDPVSGSERRGRVQKSIEDQLNRRTGVSTGGNVETRPVTESTEP